MGIMDIAGGIGLGSIAKQVCDEIGLPAPLGDLAAAAVDYETGNWMGVAADVKNFAGDCEEASSPSGSPPDFSDMHGGFRKLAEELFHHPEPSSVSVDAAPPEPVPNMGDYALGEDGWRRA